MSDARRRSLLFALLAGAVSWSGWLALNEPADETRVAEPARSAQPVAARVRSADTATPPSAAPPSVRLALSHANLFPEQTWVVPPPPPPPQPYVPPPPPQAPPLPYAYMGRWLDAGETTWYLTRGSQPVSVRAGQVLDGVWRLDQVAAGTLNFTYLPLNQTRSLRTGD